jgi:hypothetical protein
MAAVSRLGVFGTQEAAAGCWRPLQGRDWWSPGMLPASLVLVRRAAIQFCRARDRHPTPGRARDWQKLTAALSPSATSTSRSTSGCTLCPIRWPAHLPRAHRGVWRALGASKGGATRQFRPSTSLVSCKRTCGTRSLCAKSGTGLSQTIRWLVFFWPRWHPRPTIGTHRSNQPTCTPVQCQDRL